LVITLKVDYSTIILIAILITFSIFYSTSYKCSYWQKNIFIRQNILVFWGNCLINFKIFCLMYNYPFTLGGVFMQFEIHVDINISFFYSVVDIRLTDKLVYYINSCITIHIKIKHTEYQTLKKCYSNVFLNWTNSVTFEHMVSIFFLLKV
jgi:hypothetical protein